MWWIVVEDGLDGQERRGQFSTARTRRILPGEMVAIALEATYTPCMSSLGMHSATKKHLAALR